MTNFLGGLRLSLNKILFSSTVSLNPNLENAKYLKSVPCQLKGVRTKFQKMSILAIRISRQNVKNKQNRYFSNQFFCMNELK